MSTLDILGEIDFREQHILLMRWYTCIFVVSLVGAEMNARERNIEWDLSQQRGSSSDSRLSWIVTWWIDEAEEESEKAKTHASRFNKAPTLPCFGKHK